MAKIPKFDNLHHNLNNKLIMNNPRPYVGLSQVGTKCHRFLQYYHYWAYESAITSRIQRLFDFGHMMEKTFIEDLAKEGIYVEPDHRELVGETGHWKGHTDGLGVQDHKPVFLVEFKTHNDKSFKDLLKNGIAKSKPTHYGQMQGYMGYSDLELCLYLAYNKNNSEYYVSWVPFDIDYFRELKRKQVEVIASDTLLPRIGNDSETWFECKLCDASKVCFDRKEVIRSCRSCKHVDIHEGGVWKCTLPAGRANEPFLSTIHQKQNCEFYQIGEMFNA